MIWGFGKISREAAAAVPPVLRTREGKPIDQFNLFDIRNPLGHPNRFFIAPFVLSAKKKMAKAIQPYSGH